MGLTTAELAEVVAEGERRRGGRGGRRSGRRRSGRGRSGRGRRRRKGDFAIPVALTAAAKSFAVSFALGKLFSRDVNLGQGGTAQTFLANTLSNADPIPVIYGSRRVGASVVEVGITATEVQADNLHRIVHLGRGADLGGAALLLDMDAAISTDGALPAGRQWRTSSTTPARTTRRPRRR
jgi:hypothetical protein